MDTDNLKKILNDKATQISEQLAKFAEPNPDVPGDFRAKFQQIGDDEGENALEVAQHDKDLYLEHQLETTLAQISGALERIENGTYGKCTNCDNDIPEARLEVIPESKLCITCLEKQR